MKKWMNTSFFMIATLLLVSLAPTLPAFGNSSCPAAHSSSPRSELHADLVKRVVELPFGSKIDDSILSHFHVNNIAKAVVQNVRAQEVLNRGFISNPEFYTPVDLKAEADILLFFWNRDLQSIQRKGFLNQHQSGKSSGTYSPEARRAAEDRFTGLAIGASPESRELRPKSAFLNIRSQKDLAQMIHKVDDQYGDIAAVLKPEVKERSFWVAGDSLGVGGTTYGGSTAVGMLKRRGTFERGSIPNNCSYCWAYYEAVVYGELGLNDVEYFMTNNENIYSELMALGKPIYRYKRVSRNNRVVFEKDVAIFGGHEGSPAPIPMVPPSSSLTDVQLASYLRSTGRFAPLLAMKRGHAIQEKFELSLVRTLHHVLQVYTPRTSTKDFVEHFTQLKASIQKLNWMGFRTKQFLEFTDKYVVQEPIGLDRDLIDILPSERQWLLSPLKILIRNLSLQGMYVKGLGPANLLLGLDGNLVIRGTDGLRQTTTVDEALERYQKTIRSHWENYLDAYSLRDLEQYILQLRSHYAMGRAS